jgi:protein TonB
VQRFYDVSQTISDQERISLKAQVSFHVSRTGEVSNVKLAKSSGNDLFDGAVLAAVKKASPLAPPPVEVADEFQKEGVVLTFSP